MMADDSMSTDVSSSVIPTPGQDYYTVLGISHMATEKQITNSYKKLSLKYHPDRNPDDDEAKIIYQLVSTAYHTLIDTEKRKEYDIKLHGTSIVVGEEKGSNDSVVTVEKPSFGMDIGKAFGKAIQRLSLKGNTLNSDIVEAAQIIAKNDLEGGGPPLDPRVIDLPFGWPQEVKVDRQIAAYYRITIDENHVTNGFFIRCKSSHKSKFRLFILNKEGKMLFNEEGHRGIYDVNSTELVLFFTTFPIYEFVDPVTVAISTTSLSSTIGSGSGSSGTINESITEFSSNPTVEKEPLPIFQKVKGFIPLKRILPSGQYLICVYGENVIGKSSLQILISQSNNELSEVSEIIEVDKSINQSKQVIEDLKSEYLQAKAAFELVTKKINSESDRMESLLVGRDKSYRLFLDKSANAYSPNEVMFPSSSSSSSHGMFASFTAVATNTILSASTVAASVLSAATASTSASSSTNNVDIERDDTNSPLEDAEVKTSSSSSTSAPISFLITNSKAVASTATSTATAATGWLAKHITAVRTSFTKPTVNSQEDEKDPDSSITSSEELENQSSPPKAPLSSQSPTSTQTGSKKSNNDNNDNDEVEVEEHDISEEDM